MCVCLTCNLKVTQVPLRVFLFPHKKKTKIKSKNYCTFLHESIGLTFSIIMFQASLDPVL